MAVPKKKKARAATKRQRNAYMLSQHVKIMKKVDQEIRHEKNRAKVAAASPAVESTATTVIAA